jgi:hypothetical protein
MGKPDCFRDISAIERRINDLCEWLQENAPASLSEQRHLDEGTQERAYWHFGYMSALRDVLRFLTDAKTPNRKSYSADSHDSHPLA